MKTLHADTRRSLGTVRSVASVSLTLAMALTISSCAAPRLEQRAEQERQSACTVAYRQATAASTVMSDAPLTMARYLAAGRASAAWNQVAANCARRFSEGTMRSAQARARQYSLGTSLRLDTGYDGSDRLDAVGTLSIGASVLSAMALAEDRAGFATQILTARGSTDATLALSDGHKATASQLVSLMRRRAGNTLADPRQKVYAVDQLLAHPDTIADTTTGLTAPTAAVVQMQCAREELAAFTTFDAQGSLDTQQSNVDTLLILSRLVSSRAFQAFSFGYPSFDGAIFTTS